MKIVAMAFAILSMALPLAEPASADCLCRANGLQYEQGQLACLSLPEGPRLARCEKVLNNSSWTVLKESCRQMAERPAPNHESGMLAALPAPPAVLP